MGISAIQHLAIRHEVDVQHVVRILCPWMSWLNLDGLSEQLHRPLPYILGFPLYSENLAVLIEQDYGGGVVGSISPFGNWASKYS